MQIEECNMFPGANVGHRQRVDGMIPTKPATAISNRESQRLEMDTND